MKNLLKIQKTIENQNKINQDSLSVLNEMAKKEFQKTMKNIRLKKLVDAMISKVENSKDLASIENDEYLIQWCRVDLDSLKLDFENEFIKELFREHLLENHFVSVDFKNSCLQYSIGACLIVNDKGDIFDQDSSKGPIISKNDYESEIERNKLIENWMEKKGYFPSVVSMDYYGNAHYIDTTEKMRGGK